MGWGQGWKTLILWGFTSLKNLLFRGETHKKKQYKGGVANILQLEGEALGEKEGIAVF